MGSTLACLLAEDGHAVFGLRRSPGRMPAGVAPVAADLTRPETLRDLPADLDALVYAAAPGRGDGSREQRYRATYVDGLRHVVEALAQRARPPRRILFTSSTSVYAQNDGEVVDEDSPAEPVRPNGVILREAEDWLADCGLPATSLRLGGIYGPGRTRLLESVRAGTAVCPRETHYTNRIHRDDAAGALRHLLERDSLASCYVGVDCRPVDEAEVLRWLAEQMDVAPPRTQAPGQEAPARRAGSKRCSNARLLATGYRFRFPSYREGYAAVLEASEGRSA